MVKKDTKLNWNSIKKELENFNKDEIISIINKLYNLNDVNKKFLKLQFDSEYINEVKPEKIEKYKNRIKKCFFNTTRIKLSEAKTIFASFCKELISPYLKLDMMLYYCEMGTACGVEYGVDWENLYTSVEGMFEKFVKNVQSMSDKEQKKFKRRVEDLLKNASYCGYAHEDTLNGSLDEWKNFEDL